MTRGDAIVLRAVESAAERYNPALVGFQHRGTGHSRRMLQSAVNRGSTACRCGRTISANKIACQRCWHRAIEMEVEHLTEQYNRDFREGSD